MKKLFFFSSLVFLIAACQPNPPSTTQSNMGEAQTERAVDLESPSNLTTTNNQVELLDAGSESREELRFTPEENTTQTVEMMITQEITQSAQGQAADSPEIPPIQMAINTQVREVDANGNIHIDVTYSDVQLMGDENEQLRSQIEQLEGMKGSMVVSDRGIIQDANWEFPEGVQPNTQQLFEQITNSTNRITTPIPSEPVGPGARWQVTDTVETNEFDINQRGTYELVERDNNTIVLDSQIEQQAPQQEIDSPGIPDDVSVALESLDGQGSGTIRLNLTHLLPMSANLSTETNTNVAVETPQTEQAQTFAQNIQTEMTIESQE
ncbi:MAG: DUF6263 family protein [Chroococcales cyanobacterium]